MTFHTSTASGRGQCKICHTIVEKGLPTVITNLGSGKYNNIHHRNETAIKKYNYKTQEVDDETCIGFVKTHELVLNELTEYNNLVKGFDLLMTYWDSLPDDDKPELDAKLQELGL